MAFKEDNKWTHSDSILGNNNDDHKLMSNEPHRIESRFVREENDH